MAKLNVSWKAHLVFQIPLGILLFLPALSALIEIGFWQQIGANSRFVLWEYPWRFLPFVMLLFVAYDVSINRNALPRIGRFDLAVIAGLFALNLALAKYVSLSSQMAIQFQVLYLSALGLGFASYYFAARYRIEYARLLYFALFLGAILHIPAVFLLIHFQKSNPDFLWSLSISGFGSVRAYGYALEVGIALGIGTLSTLTRTGTMRFWFWFSGIVALWMMLFWSGSRGAIAAIFVALLFSVFLNPGYARKSIILAILTGMCGAALSLLIWLPGDGSFGLLQMFNRFEVGSGNSISSGRLDMWQATFNNILARPFFGYGLMQAKELWPQNLIDPASRLIIHKHVHNIVLEILLAFGFVGGSVFLFLFVKTWFRVLNQSIKAHTHFHWPAVLAINTLLAHGLVSGTYFHVHSVMYLALLLGVGLQNWRVGSAIEGG